MKNTRRRNGSVGSSQTKSPKGKSVKRGEQDMGKGLTGVTVIIEAQGYW